ncbi:2-amino-4-hydroxy-6-hydroxymethyldihydropteridine diphosphokinase [Novosphingobium mangrovi (ex Huang et al. 2023)]|uniref:2-amino-4-hydroxy-6-hydroxymethyldihydropteridine pyrophosphokinase n=1 Tax=Novosphingobium mangrovi (ex Huang et al. 2023) TaxID=2976432 RepID=A0ABT2IA05_9SPHN|nr:2-amino-4-hydroxy-6-hydroxymethyldihydropteridine diphosphokinase [Novosphingobium mangrovi (ex Huang et al. 2023)]MCT2401636.1 2-amino-4-hydroxy-6-hydroxymethyldihydropteridine diphosphokinase [Novosphingobium mangrovi (ex Huang et al. 2023)]
MGRHRYLIALGSNMRHHRYGSPRAVLAAAIEALDHGKFKVLAASKVIETLPLGPSRRCYANAAVVLRSKRAPDEVLHKLRKIERKFGRRHGGQAWGARVLDLDIVLWNGGAWARDDGEASLVIPHPAFRQRSFVLRPATEIAGAWRDPLTGLTVRQLSVRLTKGRPVPR